MNQPSSQFDKLAPHSIEAERCALASLILAGDDPSLFVETRQILATPTAFFLDDHGIIFAALCHIADRGGKIDAVLLREELIRLGKLEEIGGVQYLAAILSTVPSAAHGRHYAGVVREKFILRGIIAASNRAISSAYGAGSMDSPTEIAQDAISNLALLTSSAVATEVSTLGDAASAAYLQLERGENALVQTGIKAIDDDLGGIGQGETLVIGARPSMGKSTLARQIAGSASALGTPVGFISLEESRAKISRNMLSAAASVENNAIRRGQIAPNEWSRLADGLAKLSTLPVYIADKAFAIQAIRSVASMMVARFGIKILIVDYLQKIQAGGRDRFAEVTNASSQITSLIKELNVAGVILAQLNRSVVSKQDKRPGMTDLRESGQIEQDADQILFLHREDYYRATGEAGGEPDGVAELIKAKYRDGCRGGSIFLKSNLRYQRFDEPEVNDPFQ